MDCGICFNKITSAFVGHAKGEWVHAVCLLCALKSWDAIPDLERKCTTCRKELMTASELRQVLALPTIHTENSLGDKYLVQRLIGIIGLRNFDQDLFIRTRIFPCLIFLILVLLVITGLESTTLGFMLFFNSRMSELLKNNTASTFGIPVVEV